MDTYHKIQTVYKRDPENNHKTLLDGEYSLPEFEFLKDNEWVFTEKVDGTNIRVIPGRDHMVYRGKTDKAQMPPTLQSALEGRFNPLHEKMLEMFPEGACLYGEGYGAKIQSGGNYRPDQDFVLFDVRVGDWWLQRADVEDVASTLGLDIVPVIGWGTLDAMVAQAANGITSTWGNFQAEGIVARPSTELCTRSGERIITKIKTRDFK